MLLALAVASWATPMDPPVADSAMSGGVCAAVDLVRWFHRAQVDCEDVASHGTTGRATWTLGADAPSSLRALIDAYEAHGSDRRYAVRQDGGRLVVAVTAVRDEAGWSAWASPIDAPIPGDGEPISWNELSDRLRQATGVEVPPVWTPSPEVQRNASVVVGPHTQLPTSPPVRVATPTTLRAALDAEYPALGWTLRCGPVGAPSRRCELAGATAASMEAFPDTQLVRHRTGPIVRPGDSAPTNTFDPLPAYWLSKAREAEVLERVTAQGQRYGHVETLAEGICEVLTPDDGVVLGEPDENVLALRLARAWLSGSPIRLEDGQVDPRPLWSARVPADGLPIKIPSARSGPARPSVRPCDSP